jgi:CspA family cold shock protein
VLQNVRRLGKRIVIASIKGCCAREYSDPVDRARVKDANIIWLNDIIPEIELKYERRQLECQSPLHDGKRKVWTTFKPREGQVFYCDECRKKFAEEKAVAQKELVSSSSSDENGNGEDDMSSGFRSGEVGKLISDKGYGFINSGDGKQYFFHLTDLEGLKWSELASGSKVFFRVKKEPSKDKAGAAGSVKASTG